LVATIVKEAKVAFQKAFSKLMEGLDDLLIVALFPKKKKRSDLLFGETTFFTWKKKPINIASRVSYIAWKGKGSRALSLPLPESYEKRKGSNLVDPASSHMLVLKTKPCMSKYKYYTAKLRMAH
jgi:hypothetical protein